MEQEFNDKVQKINDEDYEIIKIIESDGPQKAIEWYKENYGCSIDEAKDSIITIRDKYHVHYGCTDVEPIILDLIEKGETLQAVKAYKEMHDCGLKEAKDYIDEIEKKLYPERERNISNGQGNGNGNGCMITILIAITTTLSAFWLL